MQRSAGQVRTVPIRDRIGHAICTLTVRVGGTDDIVVVAERDRFRAPSGASRYDLADDLSVHVGESAVGAVVAEGEALVVDAEKVERGGVVIVDGDRIDGAPRPLV